MITLCRDKLFGLAVALASGVVVLVGGASDGYSRDRAVTYMERAAAELINAQRQGTFNAFERVVRKYGHVPAIGIYALGNYRQGLLRQHRRPYYKGLARFIGRYAANESPKYPVSRVKFATAAVRDGRDILVDSTVYLRDGGSYDVRWKLLPDRRSFKVRDAQVLGFWVSPFLQQLFENYIAENGGKVGNLVTALNR